MAEIALARVRSSNDVASMDRVIDRFVRVLAAFPDDHRLRPPLLSNLAVAYRLRHERLGRREDLSGAIDALQAAMAQGPTRRGDNAMLLNNLGNALAERYVVGGMHDADLADAIRCLQQSVDETPHGHKDRSSRLNNLGLVLQQRFERDDTAADLEAAIEAERAAVDCARSRRDRARAWGSLGSSLTRRFDRAGDTADLEAAVARLTRGTDLMAPDDPDYPLRLGNLGNALLTQFERLGRTADLERAIAILADALRRSPSDHPDRVRLHGNLANAHLARFERTGADDDLDAAIAHGRAAVDGTAADDPARSRRQNNLGLALDGRFDRFGDPADLHAAVEVLRAAVDGPTVVRLEVPSRLSHLGLVLLSRFERYGEYCDLEDAVEVLERAVATCPVDNPSRIGYLGNLAGALVARYERFGKAEDLRAATALRREVLEGTPSDHPDRPEALAALGVIHFRSFARTHALDDVDAAVATLRAALDGLPAGHFRRPPCAANLGAALHTRFERAGAVGDLDEAIATLRSALEATPADHPERATALTNLASALVSRYHQFGTVADLDEAVDAADAALDAFPTDHAQRFEALALSGATYGTRAQDTGSDTDGANAVAAFRGAVDAVPGDHPRRAALLTNLGMAVLTRYRRTRRSAELDEAIQLLTDAARLLADDAPGRAWHAAMLARAYEVSSRREGKADDLARALDHAHSAVAATAEDDPERAAHLAFLADCLRTNFERSADLGDRQRAVEAFRTVAETPTAAPALRIEAARVASDLLSAADPAGAAALVAAAVDLLPLLAPRRLARVDQQRALAGFAGLAADAAALTLRAPLTPDRPARALQLLEAGRAVLMGQILGTRSDLTDLRARHPELAARFVELRALLDGPGTADQPRPTVLAPSDHGRDWSADAADRRRARVDEMAHTLAAIRRKDGFARFGRAPETRELLRAAVDGPVVVVNVSQYGTDALLVRPSGVTAVPLERLGLDELVDRINAFNTALDRTDEPAATAELHEVLGWLWDVVAEPILHELGFRQRPQDGDPWPRLWWVPGGLLNLLPIHAAGRHTVPGDHSVLDRVVSSSTPTVRALVHARERDAEQPVRPTALVVAMPTTPDGPPPLPQAPAEVVAVTRRFPEATVLAEPEDAVDGARLPTRDAVLAGLPGCSVAHFACHATSDPNDPSDSRLLLHDHSTAPLTVAALLAVCGPDARLAFLSACRSAMNDASDLDDEAIHLSSAFQLAGFPRVIGTLWEVKDGPAARIAEDFYAGIGTGGADGRADLRRSPYALHDAVRAARANYRRPSAWAAHIHSGA